MSTRASKAGYITNSLSKIRHKRWELYVISRVVHLLDDLEIEFVCQQAIILENGTHKFADMFFPQFNIYLEVNEKHHFLNQNQKKDKIRENEILRAIGAEQAKIEIALIDKEGNIADKTLTQINHHIDAFVGLIKNKKQEKLSCNQFEKWDLAAKYDPVRFLKKGFLDIYDNPSFETHRDALRCFGYKGGHYQQAAWRDKSWDDAFVWFPRFVKHKDWQNIFNEEDQTIVETMLTDDMATRERVEKFFAHERYTFAKTKDKLGQTLYRFVGVFETVKKSKDLNGRWYWVHKKKRDRVSIPDPQVSMSRFSA